MFLFFFLISSITELGVLDREEDSDLVEVVDLELGDLGLCSGFASSISAKNWSCFILVIILTELRN